MLNIKNAYELLPEDILPEFISEQVKLVKLRTRLLCALTVAIYLLGNFLSFFFIPGVYRTEELLFMLLILVFAAAIFILSAKTRTMLFSKATAYLFILLSLVILTKSNLLYPGHFYFSSSIYLFTFFLVGFTIPWLPREIPLLALLSMAGYSSLYFMTKKYFPGVLVPDVAVYDYISGLILLFLGMIFCMTLRRKEILRDIENFNYLKQIQQKQRQMKKELMLATRVHKTLIPRSVKTDLVDIAVTYLPMYYIGGDYAKFHFTGKKRLVFIICDVTGHGVSAALLVNRVHTEFERLAAEHKNPGELLDELNEFIISDFGGTEMYLSAFCGMIDFRELKMVYSNHGHPPQYIYRIKAGKIEPLPSQEPILGFAMPEDRAVQSEVDLEKNDKIVLFTDGVTENRSPEGAEYGVNGLEGFISENHSLAAEKFNAALMNDLKKFNKGVLSDDIFILSMDVKGQAGPWPL